jgi:hypothetical protein
MDGIHADHKENLTRSPGPPFFTTLKPNTDDIQNSPSRVSQYRDQYRHPQGNSGNSLGDDDRDRKQQKHKRGEPPFRYT